MIEIWAKLTELQRIQLLVSQGYTPEWAGILAQHEIKG